LIFFIKPSSEKEKSNGNKKREQYLDHKIFNYLPSGLLGFVTQTVAQVNLEKSGSGKKTFTNSLGMEFVLIPTGRFIMGSPE